MLLYWQQQRLATYAGRNGKSKRRLDDCACPLGTQTRLALKGLCPIQIDDAVIKALTSWSIVVPVL